LTTSRTAAIADNERMKSPQTKEVHAWNIASADCSGQIKNLIGSCGLPPPGTRLDTPGIAFSAFLGRIEP
jgi:hypothetical protein